MYTARPHGAFVLQPTQVPASLDFRGWVHDVQPLGGIGAAAVYRCVGSLVARSKRSFGRSRVASSPDVPSLY
eukprot:COSAG03_NODE_514_length_7269_cov_6.491353_5_plen_72_part_00